MEKELLSYPMFPFRFVTNSAADSASKIRCRVGRSASILAIEKALEQDKMIVFALQHNKTEENPTSEQIYKMGTLGFITNHQQINKKDISLEIEPILPVKIIKLEKINSYFQAVIEKIDFLQEIEKAVELSEQLKKSIINQAKEGYYDSGIKAFLLEFLKHPILWRGIDSIIHYLNLSIEQKEALLETNSLVEQINQIIKLLQTRPENLFLDPRDKTSPLERMEYARWLVKTNNYEEALEEYLWCFDHGIEYQDDFFGVRLSFLLGYIEDLSKFYPGALEELKKRRDGIESKALLGQATFNELCDLTALNERLKNNSKTLLVYDELKKKGLLDERISSMMFDHLIDVLLKKKRYGEILENVSDVSEKIKSLIKKSEESVRYFRDSEILEKEVDKNNSHLQGLIECEKNSIIKQASKYYHALLGEGRIMDASKVAQQLIDYYCSSKTFIYLIWHAFTAKQVVIANQLYEQALAILAEDEQKKAIDYWKGRN